VSKLRWLFAIGLICGSACFVPPDQIIGPANAQSSNAATASEVQVDLLRGLADIFSHGMDTLADKLDRLGYSAQVYSTHGWQSVAQRIASKYSRGHKDIVVVIGHSLGANATGEWLWQTSFAWARVSRRADQHRPDCGHGFVAYNHREIAPASCGRHAEDRGRREEGSREKDGRQQGKTQPAQEQARDRPRRTAGRRQTDDRCHGRDKHERKLDALADACGY
jgi:hypothetical protein